MKRKTGLFRELRRRNVFNVAIAYLISAWLLAQVADLVLGNFAAPPWAMRALLILLAIGFPVSLLISWLFEVTSKGVVHESEMDRTISITDQSGERLTRIIIVILAIIIVFMGLERFVFSGHVRGSKGAPAKENFPAAGNSESGNVGVPANPPDPLSVAVLPFTVMSTGPDDDYFTDGLTEEIINALSQLPELMVTARTSAFHFKGQDIPIGEIASQLDIAQVVDGSVLRAGERLRITAQLVRAADGFQMWSETYDRRTEDTFFVQQDIAEKVATALDILLDETQRKRMQRAGLRDVEASIAYQKGLELFERAHQDSPDISLLRKANEQFEQVMELVPGFDDAYIRHSDLHAHILLSNASGQLDGNITDSDIESSAKALRSDYDHAVQFAPYETQRLLAQADRNLQLGEWRGLATLNERGLQAPGCKADLWAHLVNSPFGNPSAIHDAYTHMAACDPLEVRAQVHLAYSLIWLGQPLEAQQVADKGLQSWDHHSLVWVNSLALAMQGDFEGAQQALSSGQMAREEQYFALSMLAAMRGDLEAASQYEDEFLAAQGPDDQSSLVMEAAKGNRFEANRLASLIDRRPLGYMALLHAIYYCYCGAPFDLEATPVFAGMLAESGLDWPPGQPIEFPLKDW